MTEHVRTEIAEGIMTLTLARADKKNALSNAMYSALSDGLERAEKDPAVRVVLFQGDGDSFTAGNDLADFSARPVARTPANPRRIDSSAISARPLDRSLPPCKATRSASAPRCCSIATWCFLQTPQS
jgi:enoyl-CoA hydratase/carnithine racemase